MPYKTSELLVINIKIVDIASSYLALCSLLSNSLTCCN